MRFLNIFRLPKPQSFRYIPQYYDPDKEDLQERLKRAEMEKSSSPEAMKSRISSGFRRGGHGDRSLRKKMVLKSNLMIIAILAILIMLAVLFLNSYFGRILESLM
jgi:hypothetical protein